MTRAACTGEGAWQGRPPLLAPQAKRRKIRQQATGRRPQGFLPPIRLLPCGEIAPGHTAII
ncbi:hypothetical protein D1114_07800 [Cereibacter sphaeroides]|uniref:Uncharacterized protein n=1 Tax=Cereibacter sphaeroides TaxID=1063 RepID=A0AAX1UMH6_CERSP|nr:hypothetical protein [Cereibacter sphaeroides]RHZ96020.1 hypothetical protein D1114_07800 [Cereibacter sphaeroides]